MAAAGASDPVKMHMAGESLLIVEFGDTLGPKICDAVLAFDGGLRDEKPGGLLESVPTGNTVALHFDPLAISPADFRKKISQLVLSRDWSSVSLPKARRWRMPVLYGGEAGPDLADFAERFGLSAKEVIAAHQSVLQRVFMIGFAPGFLYTGMLPELFNIPRLAEIKPRVPAGSVSVAIGQSVISSTPQATGWHTIGRTPFVNFDPGRNPPVLIEAGDKVEFFSIDRADYDNWQPRQGGPA